MDYKKITKGKAKYHLDNDNNGHCDYCEYATFHADNTYDGLCDVCDYDISLKYFTFELNQDGKSYKVVGVSRDISGIYQSGNDNKHIAIPREYKGKPVTTIGSHIFADIGYVSTRLVIPSSITTIEPYAFSGATFHDIEFEEKTDWYLVEIGKSLTSYRPGLFPTPFYIDKSAFVFCGEYTWTKITQ